MDFYIHNNVFLFPYISWGLLLWCFGIGKEKEETKYQHVPIFVRLVSAPTLKYSKFKIRSGCSGMVELWISPRMTILLPPLTPVSLLITDMYLLVVSSLRKTHLYRFSWCVPVVFILWISQGTHSWVIRII